MLFMCFQHMVCKDNDWCTYDTAYRMFIWSFGCMWTGKKPLKDWNGEPILYAPGEEMSLYGGFFFAVWCLLCDLEHGYSCYDLPNPTSHACCPLCPVGLEANLMWWNFRPLQLPGLIIFTVFSPGWLEVSMLATWGPIYSHQSL